MIKDFGFIIPQNCQFGMGALKKLPDFLKAAGSDNVMLISDRGLEAIGVVDKVREIIKGANLKYSEYLDVLPNPTTTIVDECAAQYKAAGCTAIIALGGGSPMDCAKAMCWCGEEHPPLWCIPTTAGTGSEVTSFAVLTDTDRGVKLPLVDDGLLPEAAILDPGLLDGVPPHVTADTGMDVLTHAAEAAVAKGASPFSDALAERAFSTAFQSLPDAAAGDRGAKARMLQASCMAGMAFNAAGLGVCHAMAHALGGRFHLPHGRLNALLLPQVIGFNAQDLRAAEGYGRLAKACGLAGNPRALAAALTRLRTRLKIAPRLPVSAGELREALPGLTQAALADGCLPANPRAVQAGDIQALLLEIGGGA